MKRINPGQSRAQGLSKIVDCYIKNVKRLDGSPFILEILINKSFYVNNFMDSGCLCYSAFNNSFVKRHNLPQIPIKSRGLKLAKSDVQQRAIYEITCVDMDIDGRNDKVWGYIIENLSCEVILGDPWMRANSILYNARQHSICFGPPGGLFVRAKGCVRILLRILTLIYNFTLLLMLL